MERESLSWEFLPDFFFRLLSWWGQRSYAGGNWSPSAGIIGQPTQKGNAKVEELRPAHDFVQGAKLKRGTRSQKITNLQST